jgi:prenyltransferase beta subunit
MGLEGGFQGRTNKLVDGCYSFWGAGDFPLIKAELTRSCKAALDQGNIESDVQIIKIKIKKANNDDAYI